MHNGIPDLMKQYVLSSRHMLLCATLALFIILIPESRAQTPGEDFKQNCMSCHTIGGGRITGPDLKDVAKRKDRAWLLKFISDPKAMMDAGDAYAIKLRDEARGVIMPTLPAMTPARMNALLDLIESESKLEKSQFKGIQISDRPFTAMDVQIGRDLFIGSRALKNGGSPCISCHATTDIGSFGGGTLGPDLTTVFERYLGRKTLSTWLSAPATPTMQSQFKNKALEPDEILALVAYFQNTLQRSPNDNSTARLNFILLGLGGTILILGLFDVIWNKRFRAVRRPMVDEQRAKIQKS